MTHRRVVKPAVWPLPGRRVVCRSSCLRSGYFTSASNPSGLHWSMDMAQYVKDGRWYSLAGSKIVLPVGGVITENGWNRYWGWTIRWRAADGTYWRMAHLKYRSPLRVGTRYVAGVTAGYVGNTGNSTGPHVHWEVSFGAARNPRMDPEAIFNRTRFPKDAV